MHLKLQSPNDKNYPFITIRLVSSWLLVTVGSKYGSQCHLGISICFLAANFCIIYLISLWREFTLKKKALVPVGCRLKDKRKTIKFFFKKKKGTSFMIKFIMHLRFGCDFNSRLTYSNIPTWKLLIRNFRQLDWNQACNHIKRIWILL